MAADLLGNVLLLLVALLLVLLNGFFVAAEFALFKLRHTQAVGLAQTNGWHKVFDLCWCL